MARQHSFIEYLYLKLIATVFRTLQLPARVKALVARKAEPGISYQHIRIPSRDAGRTIKADIYAPETSADGKPLPVHISWHGSGYVFPNLGQDADFCKLGVKATGAVFIDADYRKGPEYPFPAGHDDAEDVVLWVLSQSQRFDTSKVTLGGFSAGANLALSAGWTLGPSRIRGIASIYPPTDFVVRDDTKKLDCTKPNSGLALPPWLTKFFRASYIPDPATQNADPRLSPIYAPVESFPRVVYVACGNGDTLFIDGKKFIAHLEKNGHPDAKFTPVLNEAHAWDKLVRHPDSQKSKDLVYNESFDAIKKSWTA